MYQDLKELYSNLSHSKFRSSFHLRKKDFDYIKEKGMAKIEEHARSFVMERLYPSIIPNDGKQTPYKGHPVFIAQHATGCCCRGCLYKWHKIEKGRELTDIEIDYVVRVLMGWIELEYQGYYS